MGRAGVEASRAGSAVPPACRVGRAGASDIGSSDGVAGAAASGPRRATSGLETAMTGGVHASSEASGEAAASARASALGASGMDGAAAASSSSRWPSSGLTVGSSTSVRARRLGRPRPVVPSVSACRSTASAGFCAEPSAPGATSWTPVGSGAKAVSCTTSAASSGRTKVSTTAGRWVGVSGMDSGSTNSASGIRMVASVPRPSGPSESTTDEPRRAEMRPTTNMPRRCEPSTSLAEVVRIFSLASSSSSGVMPRPWSRMVMTTASRSTAVDTWTGVPGSENTVAFSSSSAIMCAAGRAVWPSIIGSAGRSSCTRS